MPPASLPSHLADDFFLTVHDNDTGKLLVAEQAASLGLAGALLGELALARRIAIDPRRRPFTLAPAREHSQPIDETLATVYRQIERDHVRNPEVSTWLDHLDLRARDMVAERLTRHDLIRTVHYRRLFRKMVGYKPRDSDSGIGLLPMARVSSVIQRQGPLDWRDRLLLGLTFATNLDQVVLRELPRDHKEIARTSVTTLPPPLRCLIREVRSAVGNRLTAEQM